MSQLSSSANRILQSHSLLETEQIGRQLATKFSLPACAYLEGDLGAGKTSLCKAIIDGFGYQGVVTSPTYNLIQEYPVDNGIIYHMDLYRLQSPEELEYLAINDLWSEHSLFLIEWPSKGEQYLPKPTHKIVIENTDSSRETRQILIQGFC